MLPIVSICCITYNHEPYIREAIEGFLMQKTNFPIEIIIHDDASTDNTAGIIREYEQKHPEIFKCIYQKENQYSKGVRGITARFTFPNARGKYIALCEGDDYWTDPLKLQKQVDFLEENEDYSFTYCRFKTFHQDTGEIKNDQNERYFINQEVAIDFDFEKFYNGWHMGTQTLMFRKSVFSPIYAANYKYTKDIHLVTHLLIQGKAACLNFFGAIYRKHQGGIYSGGSNFQNAKLSYLGYKEIYEQNKQIRYLKLKYIRFTQFYIDTLLQNKEFKEAFFKSFEIFLKNKDFRYFMTVIKCIVK